MDISTPFSKQSCLRWAGSKRLLLPELRRHLPTAATRYVEPFAGSAALFFSAQPRRALLADLNEELITTYRAIRADPTLVLECFLRLPTGKRAYYEIRGLSTNGWPDSQIAARFLYLNRYCFNGLYRTNTVGRFNVPYGPPKRPLHDFGQRVLDTGRLLDRAQLRAQDFQRTAAEAERGDFFYLDPPYAVDDRRVFREYLPGAFSRRDLQRLRIALEELDGRGIPFLLSYANGAESRLLAKGWHRRLLVVRRHMAGFASSRRAAVEMLISNRPLKD